ncbi:hypothetical protein EBT31_10730 [bacterium]|nr:hypothetical protein [bacterium]
MSEDMMPQRSDLVGKYDSYISENKKLRAEIENLRDRLYLASIKVADALAEASKLRARVKVLERVRAATIERSVSGCRASIYELECALRDSEP